MFLPSHSFFHETLSPSKSFNRRFSFSDRIVDFDAENCQFSPINPRPTSADLLQQMIVEEENCCFETMSEEKKYQDLYEIKEKTEKSPILLCEKPLETLEKNMEKPISLDNNMILEEVEAKEVVYKTESKESPGKTETLLQTSTVPCNCKKSKCLKLYCECFSKGRLCTQSCNCLDCCNKEEDCKLRKMALRNTYLKSKKTDKDTEEILDLDLESFVVPNSSNKSLGCNCKKSHCKKKYCECFDAGRACTNSCKCEGCRNCLGMRIKGKKERPKKAVLATEKK